MIELLRNCSHGSEVAVYLRTQGDSKKVIVKTASTPRGVESLRWEVDGYSWYQGKRFSDMSRSLCFATHNSDDFVRVEIDFIEGVLGDCLRNMEDNRDDLRKVVDHYCEIWPVSANGMSALHGDYSLGNAIFNKDGVFIIDWEHFRENAVPWGFDVFYLLFENMYFSMGKRSMPSRGELEIVTDNLKIICKKIAPEMLERPLESILRIISANHEMWGKYPKKLPIMSFSEDQVRAIDQQVRRIYLEC